MKLGYTVRDEDLKAKSDPTYFLRIIISYVLIAIIAVFSGIFINSFVLSRVKVDGTSMVPTLADNQEIWILKMGKIDRGDIVVFPHYIEGINKLLIKRLIGMEGDTVYSQNNKVISKTASGETKVWYENFTNGYIPLTVLGEGEIFVMGDNVGVSHDSTESDFGKVFRDEIIGRAVFV